MPSETQILYPVLIKPKRLSPFRRGTKWNPKTKRYDKVWVSNWQPVYIKRDGRAIHKRLGPEPGFKKNLTAGERGVVIKWAKQRGWEYKLGPKVVVETGYKYLDGDVDCQPDLLKRLNLVGRELGSVLWIASGNRTYEEQAALYAQNMISPGVPKPGRPLTAAPGTSNHHGGKAADTWLNGGNIGNSKRARELMRKHGLCLPVGGEPWHVEVGNRWRA